MLGRPFLSQMDLEKNIGTYPWSSESGESEAPFCVLSGIGLES